MLALSIVKHPINVYGHLYSERGTEELLGRNPESIKGTVHPKIQKSIFFPLACRAFYPSRLTRLDGTILVVLKASIK